MAIKENFISMAPDEESNAKVSLIDQNKTLMIDQYTTDVDSGNPELVEDIQNIEDAFAHFKPKVDVTFTDADGGSVDETLKFGEIRDFEAAGGKGRRRMDRQGWTSALWHHHADSCQRDAQAQIPALSLAKNYTLRTL